jgi:hemolysin D
MSGAAQTAAQVAAPRHPATELLARYRAIFQAAWQHRHELAGPARLADEQAFLPAALSLQDTPVHPAPRRIAYVLMALFLIALAWAILGKIDIVAVAPGRIIVSDRTKVIQPLERSVVSRILVKDGDHVEAGQALVELDPTSAQADKASLMETRKAAESDWLRARALQQMLSKQELVAPAHQALDAKNALNQDTPADWTAVDKAEAQAQLAAEWSDITARLAKLSAEHQRRQAEMATVRAMIGKLEATVPIARQRERDFQALTAQGFMSGHANQDRTRERIELERDLATQQARLQEAQAALREAEQTRSAYLAETRRALSERQAQGDPARTTRHPHGSGCGHRATTGPAHRRRRGHRGPGPDGHRAGCRQRQRRGHAGEQGHRVRGPGAGRDHQAGDLPVHEVRHRQSQRGQSDAGRGE